MASSVLILIITAVAGYYIFSKENIIESLNNAVSLINTNYPPEDQINIAPADAFFIARIERRFDWWMHYIAGLTFGVSLLIFFIKSKKTHFLKVFTIISSIVFLTGIIIQYRYLGYADHTSLLRLAHKIFAAAVIFFIFTHLVQNFRKLKYK